MENKEHYSRWKAMKNRCYNPNHIYYKNYGARGITVCDEWKNSYENFYKWACSSGYKKGLTIDRIDNDKGYSPENCRWATRKEQGRNQRTNRKITINGITKLMCEWAEESGISEKNILKRIRRGWNSSNLLNPLKNSNHFYTYNGEKHTLAEWSRIKNIPYSTLSERIKKGLTPFEAHDDIRKEVARKATQRFKMNKK